MDAPTIVFILGFLAGIGAGATAGAAVAMWHERRRRWW